MAEQRKPPQEGEMPPEVDLTDAPFDEVDALRARAGNEALKDPSAAHAGPEIGECPQTRRAGSPRNPERYGGTRIVRDLADPSTTTCAARSTVQPRPRARPTKAPLMEGVEADAARIAEGAGPKARRSRRSSRKWATSSIRKAMKRCSRRPCPAPRRARSLQVMAEGFLLHDGWCGRRSGRVLEPG